MVLRRYWRVSKSAPKLLRPALFGNLAPLLLICVVGVFFRAYRLTTVPGGALFDEGFNALDALRIIDGWRPISGVRWRRPIVAVV